MSIAQGVFLVVLGCAIGMFMSFLIQPATFKLKLSWHQCRQLWDYAENWRDPDNKRDYVLEVCEDGVIEFSELGASRDCIRILAED